MSSRLGHYRRVVAGGGSGGSGASRASPSSFMRQNLLLLLTVSAVGAGVLLGAGLRWLEPSYRTAKLVAFPGELLMRMLKCVVVPLIVASLITGVSQLNIRDSGRIGGLAVLYYLVTTTIAVMTGIFLVLTIRPGDFGHTIANVQQATNGSTNPTDTLDTMLDLIRNMLPDNLFGTALRQQQTAYYCLIGGQKVTSRALCEKQMALLPNHAAMAQRDRFIRTELRNIDGSSNILGIIVCSITVGIVLSQMGDKAKTMTDFFAILDQLCMRIIGWMMWYSPAGIASLIAAKVLEVERLGDTISRLGLFCVTVMTGFGIHFLFTLPLIYMLMTRKNPLKFCKGMLQAMTIAFGTASSAATLPTTIRCLEQHLAIDRRVCRFVLPVGATINMDGSAMYEAVATVFIAQMVGRPLNLGQVAVISLTSTLASIGAASIPSGALVAMVMILTAVDLPIEHITLILAVDWFLDRFRTSINVLGDAYGAAIVHHHCRKHLSLSSSSADHRSAPAPIVVVADPHQQKLLPNGGCFAIIGTDNKNVPSKMALTKNNITTPGSNNNGDAGVIVAPSLDASSSSSASLLLSSNSSATMIMGTVTINRSDDDGDDGTNGGGGGMGTSSSAKTDKSGGGPAASAAKEVWAAQQASAADEEEARRPLLLLLGKTTDYAWKKHYYNTIIHFDQLALR